MFDAKHTIKLGTTIIDSECVGRDPRKMSVKDLTDCGHIGKPLLKVIRAKCLDCCCGQVQEVPSCVAVSCPLWPYRMTKNPFREKRSLSDEQKDVMRERFARARSVKN